MPKPAFTGVASLAPILKSGITIWFGVSCMTTALGVGFIGASSVAGAWNPLNGGGSACGSSAGGSGCGVTSTILSTNTSLTTSTGFSTMTSLMTSTGRSTNTSLITSTGLSMKISLTTSIGTSLIISLGGCETSSRTFFLGFQRLLSLPQVRVIRFYSFLVLVLVLLTVDVWVTYHHCHLFL